MLQNISIVLVEPQGDENVGMAARAMKNCGITDLRLVNPVPFKTRAALKWACNADDVLKKAKIYPTLDKALRDASFIVGLSRRPGKLRPPSMTQEKIVAKIRSRAAKGRVALVFGREADGLARSELEQCEIIWAIPTSDQYPSLNLAQAVLIACHQIFEKLEARSKKREVEENEVFVPRKRYQPALKAMERALKILGYDDEDGGVLREKILGIFSSLFGRGGLRQKDVNMFLGLSARIGERITK